jgi:hypothetical protein
MQRTPLTSSRTLLTLLILSACGCGEEATPSDAAPDVAPPADAATPDVGDRDARTPTDTPTTADALPTRDASPAADVASMADAAQALDSRPALDAAAPRDAGLTDAASPDTARDAGSPDVGAPDAARDAGAVDAGRAALSVAVTVHLENHAPYDAAYATALRAFAGVFARHGAHLTLEPRQEVLMGDASVRAALAELEGAGHALGSHAAVGDMAGLTLPTFTTALAGRRSALLMTARRADHVSGICSSLDFVGAAAGAGFSFSTGSTALCMLAMAPADRPAGYATLSCAGATDPACHRSYPTAVDARIHPWRARDGAHWLTDDPAGRVVILPGSGTLPCLQEETRSTGSALPTCTLADDDLALGLADLDDAVTRVDANRVNTYYWVWGSWAPERVDSAVLERFLTAMDERVARGVVRWSTGPAMYDAFVAWESSHR